jgi:hypothetical protein
MKDRIITSLLYATISGLTHSKIKCLDAFLFKTLSYGGNTTLCSREFGINNMEYRMLDKKFVLLFII